MARDGNARVKAMYFEVEGASESVNEVMRTIASALRTPPTQLRVLGSTAAAASDADSVRALPEITYPLHDDGEGSAASAPAKKAAKARRPPPTPDVLDVNFDSGEVPFGTFCGDRNAKTATQRYLLVAVWFKDYRDTPVITEDHVFTCYKKMDWGTVADFRQPFRQLKKNSLGTITEDRGFKINHLGEDAVRKMKDGR
ncbi:MAG: hypothetical protein HY321_02015 [Armatimonadetes bacterium]|nr:hypothetical protein [Armatimonadota bacterium]